MPDTLELSLYDFQATVGDMAGYGVGERFGDTAWTADQQRRIDDSVKTGCRMVYFTQSLSDPTGKPIDDIPAAYNWSFLQPRQLVELAEGAAEVRMPRDFNGIIGSVVPASTDGAAQWPMKVVPFETVWELRARSPEQTGRPMVCAEQPMKLPSPTGGTRYTLQVFPAADADYTLQVWMELSPGPLTPEFPFPYGGAALSETFKAACRSAFEQDFDHKRDIETARFVERLRAAIAADRKHKPVTLGINGDASDYQNVGRPLQHGSWGVPFTVNGVTFA